MIHPTAIVHPRAHLDDDVEVGPYCVVGEDVQLGRGVRLHAHVVVSGPTRIGPRVEIHPFAAIGGPPQDRTYRGEPTTLEIGAETIIREGVTIHRGTMKDRGATRIGARVFIMGAVHVAHDVVIEDDCSIANACLVAGHVHLEAGVVLGGGVSIAPFVRVGTMTFAAAGARVEQDAPPYHIVQGDRARVRAVNVVGLERNRVPESSRRAIERAHRALYRSGRPLGVAVAEHASDDPHVERLLQFLRTRTTVPGPARRGYAPET